MNWKSSETTTGIGILAGGGARRMGGIDKALLRIGKGTFLERIVEEAAPQSDELLISIGSREKNYPMPFPQIRDIFPASGVIGGILSLLEVCRSDRLFIIACDMPCFKGELVSRVCSFVGDAEEIDVAVLTDSQGRQHPTCGLYRRSVRKTLWEMAAAGEYRMMDAYAHLRVQELPVSAIGFDDRILTNINTPESYHALCGNSRIMHDGYCSGS
jgi:molybdopterin-guanine dinucleotide biosynthesis protein A